MIMNFRLKPFDLISEKVLAETLGISRTPVREALARLANVGLVDIYAQRGSVVAPLRISALERSQFLRESVEVGLVTRAIVSPHRIELVEQLQREISLQETWPGCWDLNYEHAIEITKRKRDRRACSYWRMV